MMREPLIFDQGRPGRRAPSQAPAMAAVCNDLPAALKQLTDYFLQDRDWLCGVWDCPLSCVLEMVGERARLPAKPSPPAPLP